jgi:iron complex outermembrane receptor protein
VQVLKGPQGTLFGQNTTGGAVLIAPKKPTRSLEGYTEVQGGSYNWRGFEGAMNLPIGESAALRVSLDTQARDGFTENLSGPDLDDRDYIAARAALVIDLTDTVENYLIADWTRSRTHGTALIATECNRAAPHRDLACVASTLPRNESPQAPPRSRQPAAAPLERVFLYCDRCTPDRSAG